MIRGAAAFITTVGIGIGLLAAPAHAVEPPLTGVVHVDIDKGHGCAVTTDNAVWCWGRYFLGTGDDASSPIARPVVNVAGTAPLRGVVDVTVGRNHTCAVLANGQARCWGFNPAGALGDGTDHNQSLRPVVVSNPAGTGPLTGVRQIDAGDYHTCAVLVTGRVLCWGENLTAQLGDGTFAETRLRPSPVMARSGPLTGAVQVSAGGHTTCAVLRTGEARCWGMGSSGERGDGTRDQERHRAMVVLAEAGPGPLTGVRQISVGHNHVCARMGGGQARCWGNDSLRALGHHEPGLSRRPVAVARADGSPLTGVVDITAGAHFSCAALTNGETWCWGADGWGQLGNGTAGPAGHPVAVLSPRGAVDPATPGRLDGITEVVAGEATTCARRDDGRAFCWGSDVRMDVGNVRDADRMVHRPDSVQTAPPP